jgi:hypothetical protein
MEQTSDLPLKIFSGFFKGFIFIVGFLIFLSLLSLVMSAYLARFEVSVQPGYNIPDVQNAVDEYLEKLEPRGVRTQIDVYSKDEVKRMMQRQKNSVMTYLSDRHL